RVDIAQVGGRELELEALRARQVEGVAYARVVGEGAAEARHQGQLGAVPAGRLRERAVQDEARPARPGEQAVAGEQRDAAGAGGVRARRADHHGAYLVQEGHVKSLAPGSSAARLRRTFGATHEAARSRERAAGCSTCRRQRRTRSLRPLPGLKAGYLLAGILIFSVVPG